MREREGQQAPGQTLEDAAMYESELRALKSEHSNLVTKMQTVQVRWPAWHVRCVCFSAVASAFGFSSHERMHGERHADSCMLKPEREGGGGWEGAPAVRGPPGSHRVRSAAAEDACGKGE
jgi:hypothetical protein